MRAALNIRMPEAFKAEATAAAEELGVPLNALFLMALRAYLNVSRPADPLRAAAQAGVKIGRPDWSKFPGRPGKNCLCDSGRPFDSCHGRGVLEEVPGPRGAEDDAR